MYVHEAVRACARRQHNISAEYFVLGQTDQGIKNLLPEEAARQEGADPDYAQRDLYNAIENGNFPSWSMYIQVMTYDEAEKWQFNPFDLTKVSARLYSAYEVLMSIDYSCTYSFTYRHWYLSL